MRTRKPWLALAAVAVLWPSPRALGAESPETAPIVAEAEAPRFRWLGQDGLPLPFADEEAALDFLRSAKVVKRKTLGRGKTRPQLLVLERDGSRVRAVFHDIDEVKDRKKLSSGEIVYFFRDSYRNNVAVYELGRLLGMSNVPPAVIRQIGRAKGSVQLWVENAYNEIERLERPPRVLPLEVRRRVKDMWVFDNLVNNIDRNEGNMLYDSVGGFWLIDHTRTLSRSDVLPSPDQIRGCSRELLLAMRELDEARARERLAPFVSTFEIDALFQRRDKVVELIDRMIVENGEENVLFSYDRPAVD